MILKRRAEISADIFTRLLRYFSLSHRNLTVTLRHTVSDLMRVHRIFSTFLGGGGHKPERSVYYKTLKIRKKTKTFHLLFQLLEKENQGMLSLTSVYNRMLAHGPYCNLVPRAESESLFQSSYQDSTLTQAVTTLMEVSVAVDNRF